MVVLKIAEKPGFLAYFYWLFYYFTKTKESPKVYFQELNWCTTQFSELKQVYNSTEHWKHSKLNFWTNQSSFTIDFLVLKH